MHALPSILADVKNGRIHYRDLLTLLPRCSIPEHVRAVLAVYM
jgi:hypothetical protein